MGAQQTEAILQLRLRTEKLTGDLKQANRRLDQFSKKANKKPKKGSMLGGLGKTALKAFGVGSVAGAALGALPPGTVGAAASFGSRVLEGIGLKVLDGLSKIINFFTGGTLDLKDEFDKFIAEENARKEVASFAGALGAQGAGLSDPELKELIKQSTEIQQRILDATRGARQAKIDLHD